MKNYNLLSVLLNKYIKQRIHEAAVSTPSGKLLLSKSFHDGF